MRRFKPLILVALTASALALPTVASADPWHDHHHHRCWNEWHHHHQVRVCR